MVGILWGERGKLKKEKAIAQTDAPVLLLQMAVYSFQISKMKYDTNFVSRIVILYIFSVHVKLLRKCIVVPY